MTPGTLRKQILPEKGHNSLVRALVGSEVVGHAFTTRWTYEDRSVCWVTQLVVKGEWRRKNIATQVSPSICGAENIILQEPIL